MIPYRLDYVIEKIKSQNYKSRQSEIKKLTGVSLPVEEANSMWLRILEHKWYISQRIGRDIGMRVAAIDFFENIEPPRNSVHRRFTTPSLNVFRHSEQGKRLVVF